MMATEWCFRGECMKHMKPGEVFVAKINKRQSEFIRAEVERIKQQGCPEREGFEPGSAGDLAWLGDIGVKVLRLDDTEVECEFVFAMTGGCYNPPRPSCSIHRRHG